MTLQKMVMEKQKRINNKKVKMYEDYLKEAQERKTDKIIN